MWEQLEYMEFCDFGKEPTERIRIHKWTNMNDNEVGVCYRLSDQEEQADDSFYRQLEVASCSQALVLLGHFIHLIICWRNSRAEHKWSRSFLESIKKNFLVEMTEDPTRRCALLYLVLTNKKKLVVVWKLVAVFNKSIYKALSRVIFPSE